VNWMRAGRGIVHSERTSAAAQAPRAAPVRHPDLDGPAPGSGGGEPRLRASRSGRAPGHRGRRGPRAPDRGARLWRSLPARDPVRDPLRRRGPDGREPGCRSIPRYEERAIYTISGTIDVAGTASGRASSSCCGRATR
jgi:redox-sensitive bicupin YhaK (pirin superfamily)